MYLKSLVLKGFKSFADRSVLALEPGIIAVVGPNGSGKSNISDAVLWVLGERNAKHLRGQAMEDVIFAGSSARKSVGIAEVDLVLDNSDGTLPVDFDEVAVTRRMYRSGESEYLINGVVARRMDVLDILHDSGLGTGTHSIISQGSLDSILQSKPEDRRALIEEAAGVLKHKQRKAKSERKLAAMDAHLARVKDVAAEVERQLGPLERKAKRARTYQGLADELADLSLSLAVDDLRTLRRGWDDALARERALEAELEEKRAAIAQAEAAGASAVVDLTGLETPEECAAAIRPLTPGGRGADVAIEAVGLPNVWEQTVLCLRPGGTAVLFGGTPKNAPFQVHSSDMHYKEYTLKGVYHHQPRFVQIAVELLSSGKFDGMTLCTEVRPLEALVESLEDMARGVGSKYILKP